MEVFESWKFDGKEFNLSEEELKEYVGFVYKLYNPNNEMKYIGKKLFWNTVWRKKKKRRVRKLVKSDWEVYCGSGWKFDLPTEKQLPLQRTILKLCKAKGWMSYYELKYQVEEDALIREDYANGIISCKISAKHLK